MKAIIPAAGYAVRMYPLTENTPKGLLPVAGRPMVEHVTERLLAIEDIDSIFIVTNAKFYRQFLGWSKGFECPVPVKVLDDGTSSNEDRLGSIGDILFVIEREQMDDDIVIMNSDNLVNFGLGRMFAFFKDKRAPVLAMFDTKSLEQAKKLGVPELDENSRIVGFEEKPEKPKTTVCSTGIYLYPRKTVPLFRKYIDEGNSPDKTGEFVDWLYEKTPFYGFVFDKSGDKWFDVGSIETYEEAKRIFGRGKNN